MGCFSLGEYGISSGKYKYKQVISLYMRTEVNLEVVL